MTFAPLIPERPLLPGISDTALIKSEIWGENFGSSRL